MVDAEPTIFPWSFRTASEATGEVAAAQRAEPGPTEPATLPGGGTTGHEGPPQGVPCDGLRICQ